MKSHTFPLDQAMDVNHPFVHCIHAVYAAYPFSPLFAISGSKSTATVSVFMFQVILIYLIMASKHKNSHTRNSYIPKWSHKVHPLNEKVKVLNLIREKIMPRFLIHK